MTVLNSETFVIEGNSLVFTFTLDTAVSTTTSYNWKIVPKGLFPALSSDFTSLTGTVNFAVGESEKTITITTTTDTAPAVDRSFVLEITDSSDTLVASSDVITLDDDDELSASSINSFGGGESDVLGAATSFEIGIMNGLGGDDYYIITQYQQSDVSISDDTGTNVIKFDYGVEITGFSETSRFGGRQVPSFTVTLESGAEISIASPKGTLSYQIGDGGVLNYDAFKAAIGASGTNSGSALAGPFPVESSTPSPDLSGEISSINSFGGGESDVLGAATSFGIGIMNGLGGDDYYIITQYQQSDVSISDDTGTNVIKFDYGVEITGFSETSRFGGRQVPSFTVTLESGAEISIASPKGTLSYQIGDGGVLDYDAFKAAIGASGTNAGSALANSFPVPFPVVADDYGPVFTSLGSASIAEDIGEDATIYTAAAADADGDTVSYSITGGNDAGVFEIDASTGEVSLISGQSLDAEGTSSYTLTITATSQAAGEAAKAETLDVTITVTNVDEGDAVFTVTSDGSLNAAVTDDVLTVSLGASDPDGNGAGSYTYQWQRDGSDISGATNAEYTITADDEGTSLTVTVRYTDGGSTSESVTATPSVSVAGPGVDDDYGPVFTSGGSASVAEGIGDDATIYTATAADADGDTVSYSITGGNDAGVFEIDASTGEVSLISGQSLDAEGTSSYTLTITATSQAAGEAAKAETLDVTITVTNVDEGDAVFTVTSDGDLNAAVTDDVLTVSLGASDPDGNGAGSYTYQWQRDGSDISGATNAEYTITADDEGTSLTVTVTYTDGGSTSEVVAATPSVSVAAPVVVDDHGPVFTSGGSASVAEDIGDDATIYTAVAADADGDTVSYSITGGNDAGVFEIDASTGEVSLISGQSLDAEGTSSYTLTITATSQAAGEAAKAETLDVTITVTNVDEGDAVFTVTSDGDLNATVTDDVLTVSLTVSDPDGDGAGSYTYQWQRDGSDISGATNAEYTITTDDEGTSLTVTVTYTDGGSTSESVTATPSVSVAAPVVVDDHGPVFTSGGSASIAEDIGEDATIYTAVAADADGDTVSYSITGGNDAGVFEIDASTGEVSLISGQSLDAEGTSSYTLTITATSQAAGEAAKAETLDVTITVTNVDEGDAVFTVTSDGDLNAAVTDDVLTVSLTVSDPDGNGAGSYTYQWQRDGSDISGATNAEYTITADDEGTSLTVTVTYTDGGSTSESVTATPSVSVAAPGVDDDYGPVFTSGGNASVAESIGDDATIYTAVAADADGDTVSYSITGGNDAGVFEIDASTGEVSLVSGQSLDAEGISSYTLTITATSQAAGEAAKAETLDVTITVTNVDEGDAVFTVTSDGDLNAAVTDDVLTVSLTVSDPDGDGAGSYTYQWQRDGSDISGATNAEYTITADDEGTSLTVTVTYTDGGSTSEVVAATPSVSVAALAVVDDYGPVFTSGGSASVAESIGDDATIYTATAADADGDTVSYSITGGNDAGVFEIDSTTGEVSLVSGQSLDAEGISSYTLTITATSQAGGEAAKAETLDVTITVTNVDEGEAVFTVTSDGDLNAAVTDDVLTVSLTTSDPDDDGAFTYQWQRDGSDISGATNAEYTITTDDEGTSLTVTVRYTDGGSTSEVVVATPSVSVATPVVVDDHGPVFTSGGSASVAEGIGDDATIYTATAADADGDTVSYSITGGNDAGVFEIDSTTGEVSLMSGQSLDAEGVSSYTLTITATSQAAGEAAKAETLDVDITVDNVDEGDAVFTVTSDGSLNAAVTGDVLTVSLGASDPDGNGAGSYTYQWQRGGGDIAGATSAAYIVTAADLGRALTVTVSYTDDGGTDERVTSDAINLPAAPVIATNARIRIDSDNNIDIPVVGDILTAVHDKFDDFGETELSYQWFVVGGADIAGATSTTYTITEANQIIAVRFSYTDLLDAPKTVTTELSVASGYNVIQDGDGSGADTLAGTSAIDLILGGNNDDTITTGGGDDIVIGGYGRDEITLSDDGAETVVYRFSSESVTDFQSNTGWIAIDGSDMVHNFDRGTDKLVLVDVDGTPIDLAGFLAGTSSVNVNPIFDSSDDNVLTGVVFQFIGFGFPDGPGTGGTQSGRWLTLFYKEEDKVTVYNDDGTTTDEGAKFVGEDGALLDTSSSRVNRHYLTDLSLLPNYFGEGFSDGLQVIELSELGVDTNPVITSGGTATALAENTGVESSTAVYTATGTFDLIPIVWSLRGDDAGLFDINSNNGQVTFKAATTPDYETKSSYSFTVVATSGSLSSEQVVTIAVTDVDEGDAVYVIDDANSGLTEHIADASSLAVGSTLYARLSSDDPDGNGIPSYQWKRGGGDIVGATSAAYIITAADLGRALTVTVSYTDDSGTSEHVTPDAIDIPAAPVSANQASFSITSDGSVDTPLAGDELTVSLNTPDPDGNGDGTFSYQWFVIDGPDIVGATEASYTITEAGQTIAVRVSYTDSGGNDETVTTELSVASGYNVIKIGDGNSADTLAGTSADDLILGGNQDDTITTGGGDDIVIGGYGRDMITLSDDGAETVVYRFSSERVTDFQSITGWVAIDGADMVHNFDRGTDKLVLVDVDGTPIDLAGFLAGTSSVNVNPIFDSSDDNVLTGVTFQFIGEGFPDGPGTGGTHSGRWFTLFYKEEDKVTVYNDDGTTTDEGAKFVGEDGALLDTSHIQASRHYLTDLSLLPNYFGEGFSDGLQVIASSELGVGNDPVIMSGGTATAVAENTEVEITTAVYTAAGTFDLIPIVWSLRGDDFNLFSIDETSGAVTFASATTPDYDTKSSYSFTVVATSGSLSSEQVVTIAVTDVDEGDAVYVIDDADSGLAEHIANASSLAVGSTLYARLSSDDPDGNGTPSYQWKRGGVDITSATAAAYVLTADDLGQVLTVTVTYTDDSGEDERVDTATVNIPAAPVNDGQASFTITSDGSVDTPLVGDELTVTLDTADPDGDGTFSYQWFVVGDVDIAGATEASYTITETGQIIGVRVSYTDDKGFSETVTTELSVASVLVNLDAYTLIKTGDGSGEDTLAGTSADDLILGGDQDDTITTGGGGDIIIGGYGRDTVTLSDDGAETVVYRFASDVVTEARQTGWIAIDGADRINNFERGVDKLVLVDVDGTPIDLAGFLAGGSAFRFATIVDSSDRDVITGVSFQFAGQGFDDGPGGSGNAGRWLSINFKDAITVYEDYSTDMTTTAEGTRLLGLDGEYHDTTNSRPDRWLLTDFSLIPNYFETADVDFTAGLQVVEASEVGVDTNPVITSGGTATALVENTGVESSTAVYTATGTFNLTSIVWSLKAGNGDDAALFSIDSATGAVTFKAATTPDYETKSSYSFTVVATSGSLSSEQVVTIAVTDVVDEGDASYIIDDVNTGAVEHITDASSLGEGSTLYARLSSDDSEGNGTPSYQWKRGGVDIASATSASYLLTAADLGRDITVVVSYTDSRGTEESVTSIAVTIPSSFIITSDANIDTPLVGDELTVTRSIDDPDGNGDGVLTYQWFVVDGADITGATEASYTITETGQTIGVRVSYIDGGGSTEIVTTVLSVASVIPIVDPSAYVLVKTGDGSGADTLAGTSADDLIQGGDDADTITTGGGGDVVIGGYGADTITLSNNGAETVVYRFSSSGASGWTATDGGDTINNFERGVDKLLLVDVDTDTLVDLATFLESESKFDVRISFDSGRISGFVIRFSVEGYHDGSDTGDNAGNFLTINYKDLIGGLYTDEDVVTEEGEKFFGRRENGWDLANRLTDFSLLPNYLGEDLDDGLRVIEARELGVDII